MSPETRVDDIENEVEGESEVEGLKTTVKSGNNGHSVADSVPKTCECLDGGENSKDSEENGRKSPITDDEKFVDMFTRRTEERYSDPNVDYYVPGIGPVVSIERINAVQVWLMDCSRRQQGIVGPRNLRHFSCPQLFDDCGENLYCDDCQCGQ